MKIFFIPFLLIIFSLSAISVSAQPVDLRIVVDISGDVRKTAPDNQHLDALKLMINSLPAGSKAGIWTYGKYVNHFVQHDAVTTSWLKSAKISIDKIRSVASNRNIYSALKKASFDFDRNSNLDRHILLLSSGNIAVGDDQANRKSRDLLLTSLLPKIIPSGIKVHSLSLSQNSGSAFLHTISNETSGYAFVANEPDQIIYFAQALINSLNPENYIPIHDNQFAIDDNVTDFNLSLISSEVSSVSVISPSGKIFTNENHTSANWLQDKRFMRMQVKNPELGQWKISGQVSPESRVYVSASNSIDVSSLAASYITNESITVSATEHNIVRKSAKISFSDDAQASISVDSLVGENGSRENSNKSFSQVMMRGSDGQGDYRAELQGLTAKGLYRFGTVIKTLDYERGLDKLVQINELFTMDVSTTQANNNLAYNIKVIPSDNNIDLNNTTIIATVTDSAGQWTVRTVEYEPDVGWQLILEDDNKSNEYKVELDFKGSTFSGRPVHYRPKPLIIELPRIVLNNPSANTIETDLRNTSVLIETDIASRDTLAKTPSSNNAASMILPTTGAKPKNSNSWILIVAGVCLIIGSGIILFYFWEPIKRSFTKGANAKKHANKKLDARELQVKVPTDPAFSSEPKGPGNPPIIQSVVESDSEEFQDPEQTSAQPDELSVQPVEDETSKTKQSDSDLEDDSEFQVDLGFDPDMTEETELASEWRDLDAKSNLSEKVESELEVDFDVDDPMNVEKVKKG